MGTSDAELADFLRTRRARVRPTGFDRISIKGRRVPGLRREEVASLAGISVEYYARLERGRSTGVSDQVLYAVARALQLDDVETGHLFDLARAAVRPRELGHDSRRDAVRPMLQRILDALGAMPAWISNQRMDFLAANQLGRAIYSELLADPTDQANNARFVFLNPRSRTFYVTWDQAADEVVAALRRYAARNPNDTGLTNLVGGLVTRSEEFRTRWSAHDVVWQHSGSKRLNHPIAGELDLNYERLDIPGDPGLSIFVHTASTGTPTAKRLALLGERTAAPESPPVWGRDRTAATRP